MEKKISKKKMMIIIAVLLVIIAIVVFAVIRDSKTDGNSDVETTVSESTVISDEGASAQDSDDSEEESTEPSGPVAATAKLGDQDVYITFSESEYYYNITDKSVVSHDETKYIAAKSITFDDVDKNKNDFDSLKDNTALTEVTYGEMEIGGYTAETVTYLENGNYYKRCIINLDEPVDNIVTAFDFQCCAGANAENLTEIDNLLATVTIG